EMNHAAKERLPALARYPELAAAGVIGAVRNPAELRVVTKPALGSDTRPAVAVPPARARFAYGARRSPLPLLGRHRDHGAVRPRAHPIWVPPAGRDGLLL